MEYATINKKYIYIQCPGRNVASSTESEDNFGPMFRSDERVRGIDSSFTCPKIYLTTHILDARVHLRRFHEHRSSSTTIARGPLQRIWVNNWQDAQMDKLSPTHRGLAIQSQDGPSPWVKSSFNTPVLGSFCLLRRVLSNNNLRDKKCHECLIAELSTYCKIALAACSKKPCYKIIKVFSWTADTSEVYIMLNVM